MKRVAVLLVVLFAIVAVHCQDCQANISGPNNAVPGRKRASSSCSTNISGPNNASPAKRQTVACSGNGQCNGDTCVCNAGWTGENCEVECAAPTTAAPTTAPSTAAPTVAPSTAAPTTAPSTAAPTTAPTTAEPSSPPVNETPAPTAASCVSANISGPNNASPAKRQTTVCSGNGQCNDAQQCVCAPGFSGVECQNVPTVQATPAPTAASCVAANISGPNNASPAKRFMALFKRQNTVCSGNGQCNDAQVCVCAPGFSGVECQNVPTVQATPAPSSAAPSSAPSTAAPSGSPSSASPSSAAPTPGPTDNISGENNARASGAATVVVSGFAVVIAAVAMCL